MIDREVVLRSLGEVEGLWFKDVCSFSYTAFENENLILLIEDILSCKRVMLRSVDISHHNKTNTTIYQQNYVTKHIIKYIEGGYEFNISEFIRKIVLDYSIGINIIERRMEHLRPDECGIINDIDRIRSVEEELKLYLQRMEEARVSSIILSSEGKMIHIKRWDIEEIGV